MKLTLVVLGLARGSVAFYIFWNGKVYPAPAPPLYFENRQLIWFYKFIDGKEFYPRMNRTPSLTHTHLDDIWMSFSTSS